MPHAIDEQPAEATWTISEIAAMFKKATKTVREWKDAGEFSEEGGYFILPGGDFAITDSALRAFMRKRRVRKAAKGA
ncbi:MAG TPA: hypothetical protein VHC95_06925 [Opitutales bacterium]|nr:hypothetical protein [Opitutales bacterium]